jgi:hypothetical protein
MMAQLFTAVPHEANLYPETNKIIKSFCGGYAQSAMRQAQSASPLAQDQEHERIREEVEVVNIEVPVRVFYKKKPVKGLKKKDFKLFLDGKEWEINGFYEVRKKLKRESTGQAPRLFVLVFNVSSPVGSDLERAMQVFFTQVIRPKDRLMVLTNNIFLNDHPVEDPGQEMKKLKKILDIESKRIQFKLLSLETSLRYIASNLKFEIKDSGRRDPGNSIRRFIDDYQNYFNEFKDVFFNPPEAQYLKVAEYLQGQQMEKWVLYFYEIPMFPQLKMSGGTLYKAIDAYYKSRRIPNPIIYDIGPQLTKPGELDKIRNIGKVFFNTGATFHTLLLKNSPAKFFEEYDYRPVTVDSEHIFRQVTRMAHGKVMQTNNMEKFVKNISDREDVYYMLTYVPKQADKKSKIKVKVTGKKKYRTVYDDRQRARYFKKIAQKVKEEIPQVRLSEVELTGGILSARISGVLVTPGKDVDRGKILLNIKLLTDKAVLISSAQKAFKTKIGSVPVRLRLPGLKAGNYQVIVEAIDINSGRNDLVVEDLNNPRDYILAPGLEAFQFIKIPVLRAPGAGASDLSAGIERPTAFEEIEAASPLVQELQDETIDQNMLPGILKKVASYCKRLEAISLNFFCIEEIDEKTVNAVQQKGKILKKKSITENKYTYGYQLIRDENKVREKRILLKQNGWEREVENAPLKTRFKYKNIVYGPSSFNQRSQPYYQYQIIGKRSWHDKNALIVEATPNYEGDQCFASGKFWVDEKDYSILRIEIYQQSIKNFAEIEDMAKKHGVEPRLTIINEYDILKNGIRFPSRVYYEEAYKNRKGKLIIQSQAYVTFKDYRFFTVETKVSYQEHAGKNPTRNNGIVEWWNNGFGRLG